MKKLQKYKCTVEEWMYEDRKGSFSLYFAEIIAESKAEAGRIAAKNVKNFKKCKVEQVVPCAPDAVKGIRWI